MSASETAPALEERLSARRQLGRAALSGVLWSYSSFALSKLLVFASTIILARLLTPEDFGIVGYALIVIGYLDISRDLGVGAALIARPEVDRRVASSAFFLSVGWGVALTTIVVLGAPLVGAFFDDPRAVPVTRLLALGFLLSTLGSTHDALLYRGLAFNRRFIPDVAMALSKGSAGVALALAGAGYWSLAIGQLVGQACFCASAWLLQPFRPRLEWNPGSSRWLLGFGSAVVASRLLAALGSGVAFLVVGSELGAAALGLYTIAHRVPALALTNTFSILSTTLFPVYARLQADPAGLRRGYLLAQRYMALFALPVGVVLALVAPLLVGVAYGSQWREAGPVMRVLALSAALSAVGWHAGDIARAVGRARLQVALALLPTLLLIPTLLLAARWYGLPGVAVTYAADTVATVVFSTVMVRRVVRLPLREAAAALVPGATAALLVGGVTALFLLLSGSWPDAARLAATLGLAALAYAVALLLVGRDALALLASRLGNHWLLAGKGPRPSETRAGG